MTRVQAQPSGTDASGVATGKAMDNSSKSLQEVEKAVASTARPESSARTGSQVTAQVTAESQKQANDPHTEERKQSNIGHWTEQAFKSTGGVNGWSLNGHRRLLVGCVLRRTRRIQVFHVRWIQAAFIGWAF